MRQSELLGLMVEKRGSNEIAEDTADEKRPVGIKQILDNNIKPNKEEYVELNDLDRRKNHSQFSKAMCRAKPPRCAYILGRVLIKNSECS